MLPDPQAAVKAFPLVNFDPRLNIALLGTHRFIKASGLPPMDMQDPKTRRVVILILAAAFFAYWSSVPENRQGNGRADAGIDAYTQVNTFLPMDSDMSPSYLQNQD